MSALPHIALFAFLATAVTLGADGERSPSKLKRFESAEGSKVQAEVTSSVVDVVIESSSLEGLLETTTDLPVRPGGASPSKIDGTATLRIPTCSLRVMKDGEPFGLAERAHRKLKADENPNILVFLREFEVKQSRPDGEPSQEYEARGTIVIAGVTNELSIGLSIVAVADHRLELTGKKTIKISDFGMSLDFPVPVCFSAGKELKDEVVVSFKWSLSRAKEPGQ